jgi:lipopolysaccharide/colanic/teichoic acid biosynthesis glycosyltransferase
VKRAIDVVVGTALLVLALPAILLMAMALAISLRAWPFFAQDRVGRDGRTFRFVKLRTLPPHVDPYIEKYHLDLQSLPRVPRFLRSMHLDELPQLALVAFGKMSLVGPRPEMPRLHRAMPASFADTRTSMRPGCTGLWQISRHCNRLIHESPEFDLFYIHHASVRLDLWIIARTVRFMLFATPITLDDVPLWARPATLEGRELILEGIVD